MAAAALARVRGCWAWTPPHGAGRFGGKSCKNGCLQAFGIDVCTPELAKTNSPGCSAGGIKRDRLRAETRVSRGAGATPLRPGARLGPAGCRETRSTSPPYLQPVASRRCCLKRRARVAGLGPGAKAAAMAPDLTSETSGDVT